MGKGPVIFCTIGQCGGINRNSVSGTIVISRKTIASRLYSKLFVDANGAYSRKEALALAQIFAGETDVTWFEEPVSSDDLEGLRLIRDRAPVGMDIAAGEYGYGLVLVSS